MYRDIKRETIHNGENKRGDGPGWVVGKKKERNKETKGATVPWSRLPGRCPKGFWV